MLREFKAFIDRGNVLDLAVAVVVGTAFGAITTSLVDDIIMPLVGVLLGGVAFSGLSVQVGEAVITYGNFIQSIVVFVIIAFAMFLVVRGYNRMRTSEAEPEAPPEPPAEQVLLTEIRDILKSRSV